MKTKETNVLLKITALGYNDVYKPIEVSKNVNEIETIILEVNNTLATVEIVEELPMFEQREGNVVINVEKTMLASTSNVNELLSKSPNVLVAEDGVQVVGKGHAILYMDGKRISFDRLKSIPVNQIKSVEVISNPDAKYDAEGMAVVEIHMKENNLEGHEFSIMQNFTKAHEFLSYTALGYNYQKRGFSLSSDYTINVGDTWMHNTGDFKTSTIDNNYNSISEYEEDTRLTNVSTYRAGIGYQFSPKSNISLEYNGEYAHYDLGANSLSQFDFETGEDRNIKANNDALTIRRTNAFSLNGETKIDSLGSYLFAGGQYSQFERDYEDFIKEWEGDNLDIRSRNTFSEGKNETKIVAGQLDGVKFIGDYKFELGGKYSSVNSISKIELNSTDLIGTENSSSLNHFDYTEDITAGYFQWNGKIKKIQYLLGARVEHTNVKGKAVQLDSLVVDSSYRNIFPTFKVDIPVKKVMFTQSLSSRVERPGYQSLDPFQFYMNNNISFYGNPKLIPARTYSSESRLSYKGASITLGYSYTENPMRFNLNYNDDGSVLMRVENLDKLNKYYATLVMPYEYKSWSTYNTFSVEREQLDDDGIKFNVRQAIKPKFYWYTYQQLKVKDWFNLEASGEYISPWSDGIIDFKNEWHLNLGVSRFMLDNRLMVRVFANDIFHTSIARGKYIIDGTDSEFERKRDTSFIRFYVKYTFGKLKVLNYKNVSVNQSESNRVK